MTNERLLALLDYYGVDSIDDLIEYLRTLYATQDPQIEADRQAKEHHAQWCREYPTDADKLRDQCENGFC